MRLMVPAAWLVSSAWLPKTPQLIWYVAVGSATTGAPGTPRKNPASTPLTRKFQTLAPKVKSVEQFSMVRPFMMVSRPLLASTTMPLSVGLPLPTPQDTSAALNTFSLVWPVKRRLWPPAVVGVVQRTLSNWLPLTDLPELCDHT